MTTLTDIQDALQALYVAAGVTLDVNGITAAADEAAAIAQASVFTGQEANIDEALKLIPLMWTVAGVGIFSGARWKFGVPRAFARRPALFGRRGGAHRER